MGWLSGYSQRKKLTVDQTLVDADLTNFPVLVKLTSARFNFSTADLNGFDVKFTSSDGTTLIPHERERWDATNQLAEIWVMVPSVSGSTDTDFYMYWNADNGTWWEDFLTTARVESNSGISYGINLPAKYGSNPVLGGEGGSWTWDANTHYCSVLYDEGWAEASRYRMWYTAVDDAAPRIINTCYAYSSDGISWTRPTLNLYSYGGNTNNNIMIPNNSMTKSVIYNAAAAAGQAYILQVGAYDNQNYFCTRIYGSDSPDGGFTLLKTLNDGGAGGDNYREGIGLIQRFDGRWLSYYQKDADIDNRRIGAYLSESSDVTGNWTDLGIILHHNRGVTLQPYMLAVEQIGTTFYGIVPTYNGTTELMDLALWASKNGCDWQPKQEAWIPLGAATTWDDALMLNGGLVKVGNDWRYYYCGGPTDHTVLPSNLKVGYATIGYMRIGQVSGNGGTLTTYPVQAVGNLYLNCDANGVGEKIEVELLDTSGNVVTNYAQADCDDVTADSYSQEVTWGGGTRHMPTDAQYKIKFYFTGAGAKLHAYMIGNEADCYQDASSRAFDTDHVYVNHMGDDTTSYTLGTVGDVRGTKTAAANPAVATGSIAQGQNFDGGDDIVHYNTAISSYIATRDTWTLEAIVKTNSATYQTILSDQDNGGDDYKGAIFYIQNDGKLVATSREASTGDKYWVVKTDGSIADNAYHAVAVIYNGNGFASGADLYVDGTTPAQTDTWTPAVALVAVDSTTALRIGSRASAGLYMTGVIDEVRISKVVRSAAWHKATYNTQADTLLTYVTETMPIPVKMHHLRQMGIC